MKRNVFRSSLFIFICTIFTLGTIKNSTAVPAHSICADIGSHFGTGISSFSAAGDWPVVAHQQYGVNWRFMYWYVASATDPATVQWIQDKVALAQSLDAIPVITFYALLKVGQQAGLSGTEPQIVQQTLQTPALMKTYFNRFISVLNAVANSNTPVIVQIEPDSWGFMVWAMGMEGNPDATSVVVKVQSSGHPDVVGFPDHAGGLGQALLKLRDQYAPSVRLGWHASNFRIGSGGNIMASFYSSMGQYDVLFGESPHNEADPTQWWLPWDEIRVQKNLDFFSTLTSAAGVPILLWQMPIGTTDFHLFTSDSAMRERFSRAGIAGILFELLGSGNPDDFRAMVADLATVPPPNTQAGGTAKEMRNRLAAYSQQLLPWPAGSICDEGRVFYDGFEG